MKSITLSCLIEDKELYTQILQILNEKICNLCLFADCTINFNKLQDQNVCITIQQNCNEVDKHNIPHIDTPNIQDVPDVPDINIPVSSSSPPTLTPANVANPSKIDIPIEDPQNIDVSQQLSLELSLNNFLQKSNCIILNLDSKTIIPASFDITLDKTVLYVDKVVCDNETVIFMSSCTNDSSINKDNTQQSYVFKCPVANENVIGIFKPVNNPELTTSSIYANVSIENEEKFCKFGLIICVQQCEQLNNECKLVFGRDIIDYLQTL